MRYVWIVVCVVLAVAGIVLWWLSVETRRVNPQSPDVTATRQEPAAHMPITTAKLPTALPDALSDHERFPLAPKPRLETQGSEGTELARENRLRFVEAFERFRLDSGISDETAQKLLSILYDYQELSRPIVAERYAPRAPDHPCRVRYEQDLALTDLMERATMMAQCKSPREAELDNIEDLVEEDARSAVEEVLSLAEYEVWRAEPPLRSFPTYLRWADDPPLVTLNEAGL
jgi:Rad3-related DNA helicase